MMDCRILSKTTTWSDTVDWIDRSYLDKTTIYHKFHSINRNTCLVKCVKICTSVESKQRLTSAMLVAATTLRKFCCARSNTRSCSSVLKPECSAKGIMCGAPRGRLSTEYH